MNSELYAFSINRPTGIEPETSRGELGAISDRPKGLVSNSGALFSEGAI